MRRTPDARDRRGRTVPPAARASHHINARELGTRLDLQEVFQLHREGRTRVMYEKECLEDVNRSFDSILRGTNSQPRVE